MERIEGRLNSKHQINTTVSIQKPIKGIINIKLQPLIIEGAKKSPIVGKGVAGLAKLA